MAYKDPRIVEIERIIRKFRISVREIAEAVGLSHRAINYWLEAPDPRPRDSDKVDKVLALVKKKEQELSTPGKNNVDKSLPIAHTPNLDSAQMARIIDSLTLIEINATVVPVSGLWSAKSVQTKMKIGSAFPGAAGIALQIEEQLFHIRKGMVLIFTATDYPAENVFLLCERDGDFDEETREKTIGWIDPAKGSAIQTLSGELPLSEWNVTHFAHAVMWGPGDSLDDFRYSKGGIGPQTRI